MRVHSASVLLGKKRPLQKEPRPGSRLRLLWEALHLYKGEPVDLSWYGRHRDVAIDQLTDFYGCDIRLTQVRVDLDKRGRGNRHYKYALVGEWFGQEYRDYLAEKIVW